MKEQKTKSGLVVITRQHHDEARDLNCGICGASFRKDQMDVFDRHMYRCANSEAGLQLEAQSPRRMFPMLDPEKHGDNEHRKWVRKHKQALIDGRMKM